jgi:MerR family transcriptional regulator, light-induced transcriptional regulator
VDDPADALTIGELADRTGVAAATLRSWEARYGFPRPQRLPAGHRRYARGDVAVIEEILRQRAAGLSLPAAISRAAGIAAQSGGSVFATLGRCDPGLQRQVLRKATLLALTRAIEDEYCARAEHSFLFASFQQQAFYRRSEDRWRELARTAQAVVVFADFASPSGGNGAPLQVPLPASAPLRREWALVCEGREYSACLAGWEFPGQLAAADATRRFEVVWTLEPRVVRAAAIACARLAESLCPGQSLPDLIPAWEPPPVSADVQRAAGLLTRMGGYLDSRPA